MTTAKRTLTIKTVREDAQMNIDVHTRSKTAKKFNEILADGWKLHSFEHQRFQSKFTSREVIRIFAIFTRG